MVGFLNKPRATPKSGDGAIGDALNLLAGFGSGNDDLKKLLEDIREAIAHNERLISDAQVVIQRADDVLAREDRIEKRAVEADEKWAKIKEFGAELDALVKKR